MSMDKDPILQDLLTDSDTLSKQPFFHKKKNKNNVLQDPTQLQIIVVGHALGSAVLDSLMQFQNPFTKIALDGLKVIDENQSTAEIIPSLHRNLAGTTKTMILGPTSASCKTAFDALQFREKLFNVSLVQPSAGLDLDRTFFDLRIPHLNGLFVLGSQAHLSDIHNVPDDYKGYRYLRLGSLKTELSICEPEIRATELLGISLNALKNCEAPSQNQPSSTGFTAEDLCQMIYYAGRSENNEIVCLFDYEVESHSNKLMIKLLSTLIWYYMHGLNLRYPFSTAKESALQKFIIDPSIEGKKLTFLKDENEQKWWLESPFVGRNLTQAMPLIPCDYHDYMVAANDQMLTERLVGWFDLYEKSPELQEGL